MAVEPPARPLGPGGDRDAGIALVAVLWFVAMMSALAVAMVGYGRETALTSRHAVHAIEARAAMESAVTLAAASLGEGRWPATGPLTWRQGALWVQVTASPESAKIDLNAASDDLIEALAAVAAAALGRSGDEALAVAHAILDWRDPAGTRRLAGATADDYARAGRVGRPRHGPFRNVAELRSVLGMDQALFALLADAVTVHHGLAEPDGEPLPPLVEAALDRARGLGADAESAFASAVQPLDEGGNEGAPPAFLTDPRGLYTLDIDIVHEDGPGFRQANVIWIAPPVGNRPHVVLATRPGLLPQTAGSLDEVAWPGR